MKHRTVRRKLDRCFPQTLEPQAQKEGHMDISKITETIKKIQAHAESAKQIGNAEEAATFAAMVQKLLRQHQLSMTDIQFEEARKTETIDRSRVDWKEFDVRNRRVQWIERLAHLVTEAYSCKFLVIPGTSHIVLVGTESNRNIAEYVLVTLVRAADRLAQKAYDAYYYECKAEQRQLTPGYKMSFLVAFINRIDQRFREADQSLRSNPEGCTALVRINTARKDVSDFLASMNPSKASALAAVSASNRRGLEEGRKAADGLDLKGKAVEGTASTTRALS